ncbi:eukaryotic translation initiation factor 5A-like [Penaeus monodon]|uniref:eukaryotic translation initiation factor 5A-like n=1 Tax=Penaeus monodon TaxID=6687 RepID=UPI0018A70A59|nr:eukaryotic translation initiation factor 5A-like [Penaeus monodon]
MSEELQADFESGDSGVSNVFPAQCSSLRKNGHFVIKGRACKIVEISTSKTAKHGHTKVHLIGINLFTGKKYEDICPSTRNMDVPVVKSVHYQPTDISDDDYRSHMRIRLNWVTVLAAMEEEMVVATKPYMK